MQAVVPNTIKLVKNNVDLGRKLPKEVIPYLLKAVENADPKTKNDIENQLVKIGNAAIPVLVESLVTASGATKAMIAMVLIRLGRSSIEPLQLAFQEKTEFNWITNYIINEIEGSKKPLSETFDFKNLKEILVG